MTAHKKRRQRKRHAPKDKRHAPKELKVTLGKGLAIAHIEPDELAQMVGAYGMDTTDLLGALAVLIERGLIVRLARATWLIVTDPNKHRSLDLSDTDRRVMAAAFDPQLDPDTDWDF